MSALYKDQFKEWDPSYPETFFIPGEVNGIKKTFEVGETYIKSIPNNGHLVQLNFNTFGLATSAIGRAQQMTRQEIKKDEKKAKTDLANSETTNQSVCNDNDSLPNGGDGHLFLRLFITAIALNGTYLLMAEMFFVNPTATFDPPLWFRVTACAVVGLVSAIGCIKLNRVLKDGEL